MPALYLSVLPHPPSLPPLAIHHHLFPATRQYRPCNFRVCLSCPLPAPLGDGQSNGLHAVFHCPALASCPHHRPLPRLTGPLLTMHGIPLPSLDTSAVLSLFLAVDPSYQHLSSPTAFRGYTKLFPSPRPRTWVSTNAVRHCVAFRCMESVSVEAEEKAQAKSQNLAFQMDASDEVDLIAGPTTYDPLDPASFALTQAIRFYIYGRQKNSS